jgi:uncharacterized protein YecE (DUF72 family)
MEQFLVAIFGVQNHRTTAQEGAHRLMRDVYVYFDNDVEVRAPFDAPNLKRLARKGWQPKPGQIRRNSRRQGGA